MNHPAKKILEAHNLTMRFGGVTALDSLNLHVNEGEILGLLGPNGSGKTTFFNVITGLYRPSSGSAIFRGKDITGASAQDVYREAITRTFQRSRLSLPLTVFDNIAIGDNRRLDTGLFFNLFQRKQFKSEYDQVVEQVNQLLLTFNPNLAAKIFEPVASLPMIDRRRIEICRALISEPDLLLLDEPSAGMTHDETAEVMNDILQVRSKVKPFTIVLIEHEMGLIQRMTERCIVLNYGKKIAEGTYDEIVNNPEVQVAYLGQE
ncbi:ABC transporter ATP-binding protein [Polynucleobacter brandtiae]|uniref:Amino acid/amide ABC transporter ATP-binding protein 1 (HAAT family) n=1 Tax=Polynucleobacter brandtiae TaxID=1938816 RepID=A0A2M8VXV9_9BURK|nr:ABC transporter ATP-binding protein [Polynucleobacter brandtiae]PJI82707.1 amino acid/amide ABC transporter ATP-binding protein 1 (HAAT family) [Polynucleobacter brandtiae]